VSEIDRKCLVTAWTAFHVVSKDRWNKYANHFRGFLASLFAEEVHIRYTTKDQNCVPTSSLLWKCFFSLSFLMKQHIVCVEQSTGTIVISRSENPHDVN
jgi:hypothetical protein